MKKCPYCAEEIQDEAIVCRHCGRELTTVMPSTPSPQATAKLDAKKKANNALIQAIVGFFCFGIILGPAAIYNARKAKEVLASGDDGYGTAQAAEIVGWIVTVLYILAICFQLSQIASNNY